MVSWRAYTTDCQRAADESCDVFVYPVPLVLHHTLTTLRACHCVGLPTNSEPNRPLRAQGFSRLLAVNTPAHAMSQR